LKSLPIAVTTALASWIEMPTSCNMPARVSPASSVTVRVSTPGPGLALSELSAACGASPARISFMNRA